MLLNVINELLKDYNEKENEKNRKNFQKKLQSEMNNYELEDWQKELVENGDYELCNFDGDVFDFDNLLDEDKKDKGEN